MGGQEALTILFCATACAALGDTVVVAVSLIFSPDDLAIFSKFKRSTTITLAGRAAILVVSAIEAGVGAQIGIAKRTISFMAKNVVRRTYFPKSANAHSHQHIHTEAT